MASFRLFAFDAAMHRTYGLPFFAMLTLCNECVNVRIC